MMILAVCGQKNVSITATMQNDVGYLLIEIVVINCKQCHFCCLLNIKERQFDTLLK